MKDKKKVSALTKLIPSVAKKIGEHSVNSACVWWYCQPKVPNAMLKKLSREE